MGVTGCSLIPSSDPGLPDRLGKAMVAFHIDHLMSVRVLSSFFYLVPSSKLK